MMKVTTYPKNVLCIVLILLFTTCWMAAFAVPHKKNIRRKGSKKKNDQLPSGIVGKKHRWYALEDHKLHDSLRNRSDKQKEDSFASSKETTKEKRKLYDSEAHMASKAVGYCGKGKGKGDRRRTTGCACSKGGPCYMYADPYDDEISTTNNAPQTAPAPMLPPVINQPPVEPPVALENRNYQANGGSGSNDVVANEP